MRVPFVLVDVFAERPFAGNQLCVVPEVPAGLDEAQMRTIAAEIGFSETTFVTSVAPDRYEMRIFTPTMELPFAGHPTLGTSFVLAQRGLIAPSVIQVVAAGEFAVRVDVEAGTAAVLQQPPVFGATPEERRPLAEAVGVSPKDLHPSLPPQVVGTGLTYLLIPLDSVTAVTQAVRNDRLLPRILNEAAVHGCYLFAITGKEAAKARMFDSDLGILEDPATGSAAGPLGAYLAERGEAGMPGSLVITQGEELGRPSKLHVSVVREDDTQPWSVTVGGSVFVVGDGAFEL